MVIFVTREVSDPKETNFWDTIRVDLTLRE